MPYATTDDSVKLWYEETGTGQPIVFVHEFAADHRSWEMQMRHFGQRYRCITFSARVRHNRRRSPPWPASCAAWSEPTARSTEIIRGKPCRLL